MKALFESKKKAVEVAEDFIIDYLTEHGPSAWAMLADAYPQAVQVNRLGRCELGSVMVSLEEDGFVHEGQSSWGRWVYQVAGNEVGK